VVRALKGKIKPSQADLERTFIIIPAGEARNIGVREQNGRKGQRRVLADRRKGERRVVQVPVQVELRVMGERRVGERRVLLDRRKA